MNTLVSKVLHTNSRNWVPLPLRLALGLVMVGHGAQKLFGWWGGYGLEGTAGFFSGTLGLNPGIFWAALAGGTEFFGGLALLIGLATRLSAAGIGITMLVAVTTVHSQAFFLANNGMEFALSMLLIAVALVISGGGALSLDARIARNKTSN